METFFLTGPASLTFVEDMDEFKRPETIHFPKAMDAVRHAIEKLTSDQLWSASVTDEKGTRIGAAQIRSIYDSL